MKSKRRLTANPLFGEFERALYQIKLHPWQGHIYRSVMLEFARSSKLLEGRRSYEQGGR